MHESGGTPHLRARATWTQQTYKGRLFKVKGRRLASTGWKARLRPPVFCSKAGRLDAAIKQLDGGAAGHRSRDENQNHRTITITITIISGNSSLPE